MSRQLSVSHATVLQAYANLEDQGMIRARPQSGFYVHQTPVLTAPTPDIARGSSDPRWSRAAASSTRCSASPVAKG